MRSDRYGARAHDGAISDLATWWHVPDIQSRLEVAAIGAAAERIDADHVAIDIHAHGLVRDLTVYVGRTHSEAVLSDQMVTLLPDGRLRLIATSRHADPEQFTDQRWWWTANDLVALHVGPAQPSS